MRDHDPVVINDFNGWWDRDDEDSAPLDHFNKAINIQFIDSGIETRYPLDKYQDPSKAFGKVLRVYNYVTQTGQTLLVLVEGGIIHHVTDPNHYYPAILTIPTMTDFGFVAISGRAYITPFTTYVDSNGQNYELGLPNENLYVYLGVGDPARKAGGVVPISGTGTPYVPYKPFLAYTNTVINGPVVSEGIHIVAVSFNYGPIVPPNTGDHNAGPISHPPPILLPPFANRDMFPVVYATGTQVIQLTNIPLGPPGTISRKLLMTLAEDINTYKHNGPHDWRVAETLPDNTTTTRILNPPDATLTFVFVPDISSPYHESSAMMVVESLDAGFCDLGFHLVGVVYETNSGYLTAVGPEFYGGNTYVTPTKGVTVLNIPTSPDPSVTKRHLVSTKAIFDYNGDQKGYQFFFIPKGTLNDNISRAMNVSYYDSDLLSDASHLMDNYDRIPAGVSLCTYHSRLVLVGDPTIPVLAATPLGKNPRDAPAARPDNRSVAWLSAPGEPEAISKVDGLIVTPLDGNPLTNCQEFRDALYLFKRTRTYAYVDNQDEPASWSEKVIDEGTGASVHGIGTVLDSGGVNIDFLMVANWSGLMLFNGTYARPEISFKIENFWLQLDRNGFRNVQIINDSISKKIYITLPTITRNFILYADYKKGLDPKNIKWVKWEFDGEITTACLINTNKITLGAALDSGGIYFINSFKPARHDSYNNGIEKKIPNPIIRTSLLGG